MRLTVDDLLILALLFRRGPRYRMELPRQTGIPERKVLRRVARLLDEGLLSKRDSLGAPVVLTATGRLMLTRHPLTVALSMVPATVTTGTGAQSDGDTKTSGRGSNTR